jgi:PKD repeat protein
MGSALLVIMATIFAAADRKKSDALRRRSCTCAIFTLMMLIPLLGYNMSFHTSEESSARITNVYSCDASGIPQDCFPRKTAAHFNVGVRNFADQSKDISLYLTVKDELNVPVGSAELDAIIDPNASEYFIMSVFLPKWAFVGQATAYASLVEGGPVDARTTKFWIDPEDLIPPAIHILCPENATCVTRPITLIFTTNERTAHICLDLDGLNNVTISGNTTVTNVSKGIHRIVVYGNDTSGNVAASDEICFTVLNQPPLASFSDSASVALTGTTINFNASSSFDPDGSIASCAWTFGDGTSASGMLVNHSYANDGAYNVTLTVIDNEGALSARSVLKTILNRPPVANFRENAATLYTGEIVEFNASASYDPDGIITAYLWNFGDSENATGAIVGHSFHHDGIYAITLTVIDEDGLSASTSTTENVINRPDIHVSNLTSCKTVVGQRSNLEINVTLINKGGLVETFNVTVYVGVTPAETRTITLSIGGSTSITYILGFAGLPLGKYALWIYAEPVPDETCTKDNVLTDGSVTITIPGDVNGDFKVDGKDIGAVTKAYGTQPGDLRWNSNADMNSDYKIDGEDIAVIAKYYNTHYP